MHAACLSTPGRPDNGLLIACVGYMLNRIKTSVESVVTSPAVLPGFAMESYSAVIPFEDVLKRLRRALSRSGFEVLRECDVGLRIRGDSGTDSSPQCRILYVIDPDLFATAISAHASAALWLPISLVVCKREESVEILLPAYLIVRDRATLIGLRTPVEELYSALAAALDTVAARDHDAMTALSVV